MLKKACGLCKVVGALAVIGALNWGAIGLLQVNVVENILGQTMLTRIVYDVVGLAGLALLASYFIVCPACKK
ncbi:MAG: DUF378 domain-containing protein [Candidatus Omnitrophica bacterium]|nr:DUF378 domain-containing protein [Candidatus Omnitrophota bacterium]